MARTVTDPQSPEAWQDALERLGVEPSALDLDAPEVKGQLKNNTTQAAGEGVFGVPTIVVGERLFWGLDALPMLQAAASVRFGARRT